MKNTRRSSVSSPASLGRSLTVTGAKIRSAVSPFWTLRPSFQPRPKPPRSASGRSHARGIGLPKPCSYQPNRGETSRGSSPNAPQPSELSSSRAAVQQPLAVLTTTLSTLTVAELTLCLIAHDRLLAGAARPTRACAVPSRTRQGAKIKTARPAAARRLQRCRERLDLHAHESPDADRADPDFRAGEGVVRRDASQTSSPTKSATTEASHCKAVMTTVQSRPAGSESMHHGRPLPWCAVAGEVIDDRGVRVAATNGECVEAPGPAFDPTANRRSRQGMFIQHWDVIQAEARDYRHERCEVGLPWFRGGRFGSLQPVRGFD